LDREIMNDTPPLDQLATKWQIARSLHPLYANLAKEFVIDSSPCPDLEKAIETPSEESVEQAEQWLSDLDGRIQVHQLRQFLQSTSLVSEEALRNLLLHHLGKTRSPADRDKIDFLLVQYFAHCAPSGMQDENVDFAAVAQVLEPVLGPIDATLPEWLEPVEKLIADANVARDLNQLLATQVIEKGRQAKEGFEADYYLPPAMVAFTRFGFVMRRLFFRLMYQDLNATIEGLRELESRGVATLDCRRAQFSAEEPIARLRMICQSWKVLFHAEYSSGQPLRMLVDLLAVVKGALARTAKTSAARDPRPRTLAAAAGAGQETEGSEFQVLPSPVEPNE
jgi:hypothetical protein